MFDPALFAEIGKNIANAGSLDKEARCRTALGRAYYALFLSIRSALRQAQGRPIHGREDHLDHGRLPIALYSAEDPALSAIAKLLDELNRARRTADYVLDPEGGYQSLCISPRRASILAKRTAATIRSLRTVDFAQIADHPAVN